MHRSTATTSTKGIKEKLLCNSDSKVWNKSFFWLFAVYQVLQRWLPDVLKLFWKKNHLLFRYYLRFKDAYRQAAIDVTHGKTVSEDMLDGKLKVPEEDVREMLEKEENVKQLIEDCKKMLIVEPEECLGGWSLVNADPV